VIGCPSRAQRVEQPGLTGCGKTGASYQGIAFAMPKFFEVRCPFRGWASHVIIDKTCQPHPFVARTGYFSGRFALRNLTTFSPMIIRISCSE